MATTKFEATKLARWLEKALAARTTYFKVRRQLFTELTKSADKKGQFKVDIEDFATLKNFLLSRNDKITDDKTLAFDATIAKIAQLLEEAVAEEEEAAPEAKAGNGGGGEA